MQGRNPGSRREKRLKTRHLGQLFLSLRRSRCPSTLCPEKASRCILQLIPSRIPTLSSNQTLQADIFPLRSAFSNLESDPGRSSLELSILFHTGHRYGVFSVGITLHG